MGPEKSGECCRPRMPGKDAGLPHRLSEEPRKGAEWSSSGSARRAQGSRQIRSLFLDSSEASGTFMCHAVKMWVYSLEGLELGLRGRSKAV